MKLDYHGDSGIVEPHGNVRIQTQTPAKGILSAMAIYRQFINNDPERAGLRLQSSDCLKLLDQFQLALR
jgi:hypothetical protein